MFDNNIIHQFKHCLKKDPLKLVLEIVNRSAYNSILLGKHNSKVVLLTYVIHFF